MIEPGGRASGTPVQPVRHGSRQRAPSSTDLNPRTAAALAYLAGPFSGPLMLWVEREQPFVRFHAWQSVIGLGGLGLALLASYVLAAAAMLVSATAVTVML